MKKTFTTVIIALIGLFSFSSFAAVLETDIYTVSPYDNYFRSIDTTDMVVVDSVGLTSSVGTVTGANGLSIRPCSGEIYIAYKVSGFSNRQLGIVDETSGVISPVGDMGDKAASLVFGDYDHLYAVTGDGGSNSEKLYKVNINTGLMTFFSNYGNGSDGESISFCPDNGRIYHWSGRDSDPAMESTDTITGITSTITRTGYNYDEVFGAAYIGNGEFLLTNLDMETIVVDTSGFAVLTGSTSFHYKGIGFPIIPSTDCLNPFTAIKKMASDYTGSALTADSLFSVLFISEIDSISYMLYDNEGIGLDSGNFVSLTTFDVDLGGYSPGTYYLYVSADGSIHVVRIVIPGVIEEEEEEEGFGPE